MKKRIVGFTISAVAVVVVAVASFVSFKVYNANAGADKGVAAKVNGEIIYINDLKQSYADHPQIQDKVPFEEFYAKTLDVFVNSNWYIRLLLLPILSRHRSIRDSWLRQRKIWLANCILKNGR